MSRFAIFFLSLCAAGALAQDPIAPATPATPLFPIDREKLRAILDSPEVAAKFKYYQGIDGILKVDPSATDALQFKITNGHCRLDIDIAPSDGAGGATDRYEVTKIGNWVCGV